MSKYQNSVKYLKNHDHKIEGFILGSYSGRPKEEGGHKPLKISVNKFVREALEKVPNKSKFLEEVARPVLEKLDPGDASFFLWKIDDFISEGIIRATQEKDFKQVSALSWLANCLEDARRLCGPAPQNFRLHKGDRETGSMKKPDRMPTKEPIILSFLMVAIVSIFGFITLRKLGNVALQSISNQTGLEAMRIMVQVSPYLILSPVVVFAFALLLKAKRLIQSKLKLF